MNLSWIAPSSVHPARGYTHVVRAGDLLFVSGQVSQDPTGAVIGKDDIRAQVAQVYINLKNALEAANSDVAHIIKTTVFVTSPEYRSAIVDAREDVFGPLGHYPASTYLVVSRLGNPDWLVEIEAIAALK